MVCSPVCLNATWSPTARHREPRSGARVATSGWRSAQTPGACASTPACRSAAWLRSPRSITGSSRSSSVASANRASPSSTRSPQALGGSVSVRLYPGTGPQAERPHPVPDHGVARRDPARPMDAHARGARLPARPRGHRSRRARPGGGDRARDRGPVAAQEARAAPPLDEREGRRTAIRASSGSSSIRHRSSSACWSSGRPGRTESSRRDSPTRWVPPTRPRPPPPTRR